MNDEDRERVQRIATSPRTITQAMVIYLGKHAGYEPVLEVARVVSERAQKQLEENERFLRELEGALKEGIEEVIFAPDIMYEPEDEVRGPPDSSKHYIPPRELAPPSGSIAEKSNVVYLPKARNRLR